MTTCTPVALWWPQTTPEPPEPFPIRQDHVKAVPRSDTPRPRRVRVLVVEDNRDVAEAMQWILEAEGAEVEWAGDGEQALAAVERFRPDAVLLDLGLPRLGGHDVASRLRGSGFHGSIIVMTGFDGPENRRRSLEVGCDHHLVKPVDPHVVLALLGLAP